MKITKVLLIALLIGSSTPIVSQAQTTRPVLFIEASDGFEVAVAAAITKKHVPVDVTTDRAKATLILHSSNVDQKIDTDKTGTKVAKMIFGVPTILPGSVSVQLQDLDGKVLWGYNCTKARGKERNVQSLSEAIAKHLKNHLEGKE